MIVRPLLLLASNSPRRRKLISLGNWTFGIIVANVDESLLPDEEPANYVLRLAESKARAVLGTAHEEQIIIGADTAVIDSGDILGKPLDSSDAKKMLRRLRGHAHQVYSGIAALRASDQKLVTDLCITDVPMRPYSDQEIEAYVETGDPLDKAGAYAIQHPDFQPVKKLSGCFASVMGLPMCHIVRALRKLEVEPEADVPASCQAYLNYRCNVSSAVLRGENVG